jgi:hypothetical protein
MTRFFINVILSPVLRLPFRIKYGTMEDIRKEFDAVRIIISLPFLIFITFFVVFIVYIVVVVTVIFDFIIVIIYFAHSSHNGL